MIPASSALVVLALLACDGGKGGDDTACSPSTWTLDQDGDGWAGSETVQACAAPANAVDLVGDCDDADAAVHPDATEVCDGVDNDCDGVADPPDQTWYVDSDGDGYGDPDATVLACAQPDGAVDNPDDCDDTRADAHPDGVEVWYDGVDQDCDGGSDYDADLDAEDSDAYGGSDCDDSDPLVGPHAEEICHNGVDDDCDGWDRECDLASTLSLGGADLRVEGGTYNEVMGLAVRMTHRPTSDGLATVAISAGDSSGEVGFGAVYLYVASEESMRQVARVTAPYEYRLFGYRLFEPQDYDGDGVVDLAIHASQSTSFNTDGPGETFIYMSTLEGEHTYADADVSIAGDDDLDWGAYGLTGVLNWSTERSLVAVSSPAWDVIDGDDEQAAGRVGIIDITGGTRLTLDDAESAIECNTEQCMLGTELLATDLNGDGIDDLLASIQRIGSDTSTPGMLAAYLGPIEGTVSARDYDGGLLSATSDRIGEQMESLGDQDGDGYDEIWMGAELDGAWSTSVGGGIGTAYLYSADDLVGLDPTGSEAELTIYSGPTVERLGRSLSHGDVDGDGELDLLAGANQSEITEDIHGSAHLWYAPGSGTMTTDDADVTWQAETDHGYLGWSLAADDDLNADGCDDVVISEPCWPGKGSCYGAVGVFYGGCE